MRRIARTSWIGLAALATTACGPGPAAPNQQSPVFRVSDGIKAGPGAPIPESAKAPGSGETAAPVVAEATKIGETRKTLSGLAYTTLAEGKGEVARPGDKVGVQLRGTLENGTDFQDTRKDGKPLSFVVGSEEVVLGLDEGVAGMRVGERRKLTVPSRLGYGALGTYSEDQKGKPLVPPNATLTYEVELTEVTPKKSDAAKAPDVSKTPDTPKSP